jgi:hypothetical protein
MSAPLKPVSPLAGAAVIPPAPSVIPLPEIWYPRPPAHAPPSSIESALTLRPPMSLLLRPQVSVGAAPAHAEFDPRFGKVSVPTDPLGAAPPTQFVVFDQFAAPAPNGIAPLHVKSVSAAAEDGKARSPAKTTTARLALQRRTTPNPLLLIPEPPAARRSAGLV